MAIKVYKPTSNGRRNMTTIDYSVLTTNKPEKSLLVSLNRNAGRNNKGHITVRHKGGGHKKRYRLIDFKRDKDDIMGNVFSIEYDPYRNCFISLIHYSDGEKRYIIHCKKLVVGMKIISGNKVPMRIGNTTYLKNIPDGMMVHNVELNPGQGGLIARAAGTAVQIISKSSVLKYVTVKMSSGEVRKILGNCRATIGTVSNEDYNLVNWGKAGRNRWKGIRPTVRGSAMNPIDHPHGGGTGKAPIGRKTPMSVYGKKVQGIKTTNPKRYSHKLILKRRIKKH